eukprot:5883211-Amphidinium_carterae.1
MSLLSGSVRERRTNYHMVWPMKLGLLNPPTRLTFVQGELQKTTEELGFSAMSAPCKNAVGGWSQSQWIQRPQNEVESEVDF